MCLYRNQWNGKSTLVNMILHPDKYLYDGKLIVDVPGRIGYVSQFYTIEREKEVTVFDYISEEFVRLQNKINQICEDMAVTDHLEKLMEEYQQTLDEFNAIDGDFYESNIRKQLKTAGLAGYEDQLLTNLKRWRVQTGAGHPGDDDQPEIYYYG